MKRIYTLLLLTMLTLSINAQPILCGHRGSLWGVENTSEAFINGAKKGYKYLECDVKVTGDGEYIISHDDNTSRLGGNLTIASATLAQLKAETYTQTRGGVKYTGQICTVAEYLQICKDHNVKPLIELKWATGINNNDCSKIPGLISLIDNYGFKQEAIILTSMKPCLEYIRTNLTDNFPSSMGEEKIGYLMGAGEVKDGCIYLYLFAQNEGMVKYVIEGEVPDGNTGEVDFKLEKVWSKTVNENNAPDHIDGTNAQQGGAHNGIFYVNDCVDKLVYMFNENGLIGTLPGGTGWGTACDDAGNIIIRNDKSTTTSHSLLIYPSGTSSSTAEAKELTFDLNEAGQTNFISASGDVLGEGGYVYFFPNKQTVVNILKIVNGEVESVKTSENLSITGSTAGYVIPIKNNPENWLYQVRGNGYYLYNGGDKAAFIAGSSSTTAPNRNSTCGGEYFTLSSHDIMIYNSGANYTGGFTIKDITADQVITSVAPIGNKGYTEGGNYSVSNWMFAEKIDAGSYYLYQYCPANGMAVYRFYDANYTSGEEKITDQPKDGKIKIYPNPAEYEIFIESNETVRCADIYNLSGSLVKTVNLENTGNKSINIENLASGIYIVKINKNEKGERFIKK